MRSVFIQRPVEYHLEAKGEEWCQGDLVKGTLRIKNTGSDIVEIDTLQILLTYGLSKKIKAGQPDWNLVQQLQLATSLKLSSQEEHSFEWTILLSTDCAITDQNGGLFLLYGNSKILTTGGKIDLRVKLMPVLQNFLQTFETQFRFARKYEKYKDGWTEVKLVPPPNSKEYPTLEQALCNLRIRENELQVQYEFKVQALGKVGDAMKAVHKKKTTEQSFKPEQYLQAGGFPNRLFFREQIKDALQDAKPGSLFNPN